MTARGVISVLLLGALGGCGSDEGGSGGSGGVGGAGGTAGASGCDVSQVSGIGVAEIDLDAFPPYALDACNLLYVAAPSGDLVLRDLETGSESVVAPASESPRRPALAGTTLAWEAEEQAQRVVVVSVAGDRKIVSGSFDHAGEPRATEDAVVFTGWLTADDDGDSDVFLFDVTSGSVALVAGGPAQQRFSDISATHVAYTDFSEDPNGYYTGDGASLADVALHDRATGTTTSIPNLGKQAFPMLAGSGRLGFLEWIMVHPIPKLQAYTLKSVPLSDPLAAPTTIASVESDARVRPTASGELFEWVVRWEGATTLHRARVDGSSAPSAVPVSAAELHAPVANAVATVLAIRPVAGAAPELETVEH